ncbi:MAG: response regulator [Anaerolineae bacterium]|nr:response regulator [Anaerolineae bacterium]
MTRVLIAEDNVMLLENIALELELRGYEVIQAENGLDALNRLRTGVSLPDIVVSDIAMPQVDGFKLLEYVRSTSHLDQIPFLFLTAYNAPDSIRLSRQLGVDDYVLKPFQASDLVIAMENKLKRTQAIQSRAQQSLDKSRQALVNMMAHELRTPLTSIFGGSEMLEEILAEVPDQVVHRMIGLIRTGAQRLVRLTRKAQALLELDGGIMELAVADAGQILNLLSLVKTAIANINQEAREREKPVSIMLDASPEVIYVFGLPVYLVMMIEELLRNAVAFTPPGGVIKVTIARYGGRVSVSVKDHGPGVPEKEISRIWERFVQLDRDHYEQQGCGLGLPIVRGIAQVHGGSATLTSKPGGSTRAVVSLQEIQDQSISELSDSR